MTPKIISFLSICFFSSLFLIVQEDIWGASRVVRISASKKLCVITQDQGSKWHLNEIACVRVYNSTGTSNNYCGIVIKSNTHGAIVRFDTDVPIQKGNLVQRFAIHSFGEIVKKEKAHGPFGLSFNIGTRFSTSTLNPTLTIQKLVTSFISVGFEGAFFSSLTTSQQPNLVQGYSGLLLVSLYSQAKATGYNLSFLAGGVKFHPPQTIIDPFISLTIGYRNVWANPFLLAFQVGGQYLFHSVSSSSENAPTASYGFEPCIQAQFGVDI